MAPISGEFRAQRPPSREIALKAASWTGCWDRSVPSIPIQWAAPDYTAGSAVVGVAAGAAVGIARTVDTAGRSRPATERDRQRAVVHVVDSLPGEIKSALIPNLIDAYRRTSAQAARKQRYLKWALVVMLVAAIAASVVKIIRG